MKKSTKITIGVIVVIALVAVSYWYYTKKKAGVKISDSSNLVTAPGVSAPTA